MTQSYEQPSFHTVGYIEERQAFEAQEEPDSARELEAPLSEPARHSAVAFSVPTANRREVAFVIGVSALLHAGGAFAAFSAREEQPHVRHLSRVEIQMARPERPRPALVPPPPPPEARVQPKPAAAPPTRVEHQEARPETPPEAAHETPVDTGSSLPSAADGTLFAGSGGLGTAAPPPPAPPPLPVHAEQPARVIPAHEGANYLKNPRPEYPRLARQEGWEGTTLLRVQVAPNGHASAIQVQRSSGREALDNAAKNAVQRWSFVPATQGTDPVSGWVTVPIVFRLQ